MKVIPIIIAGGSGSRLWPLSRLKYPKQFLSFSASGKSMLQSTIERLHGLNLLSPIIITNEDYRFLVAEQLRCIGVIDASIILEPVGKNTAPAIALAAIKCLQEGEDVVMLVLPADHVIENIESFHHSVSIGLELAESGKLVTFGVKPNIAETGYGYIEKGGNLEGSKAYVVKSFFEKPDFSTAKKYLDSGNFFWNSGVFSFKAKRYIEELEVNFSEIIDGCRNSIIKAEKDIDFLRVNREDFEKISPISIDYAVMENTADAVVVPLDASWSDVGSWSALWDVQEKDSDGNVLFGDVIAQNSNNSYVYSENKLVATVGIKDLVVVETKDAILVANKNNVQDVKFIVEELKKKNRCEYLSHRIVYRPWGFYDSVDYGVRYRVKRIVVNPGGKLSVQLHHHRAEHWIIVSGTAKIKNGDDVFILTEDQSTYIPVGRIHSLENPGKIPLELIEVQSGPYLEEDDIVRIEDKYGRV